MNILVVEDQETTRSIVSSRLRNWGHSVVDVENGKAALSYIIKNPGMVDILVTDWDMPVMDGVTLARNVRNLTKKSKYIYIILFTVKSDDADLIKGFSEGQVDDYIIKPFSAVQLRLHVDVGCRLIDSALQLRKYASDLEKRMHTQIKATKATQEEIIYRLFNALESRDNETARHVERIGIMSACLANYLGWDEDQVEMLRAAAPLHDIGKIGIRDALLLKAGRLTAEEYKQLQRHTVIGAQILSGSKDPTIQMAERIALSHHENWDGSGYPNGLCGGQIPIEAQVVSIVDVYDAQLSDRVYRRGLPEEEVLDNINEQIGIKFSPKLGNLFMDCLDEIKSQCWACLVR